MDPYFVVQVKCTNLLAQYRFEGIFGFACAGFSKNYLKLPFWPQYLLVQNALFWRRFWFKNHSNHLKPIVAKKKVKFCQQYIAYAMLAWKGMHDYAAKNNPVQPQQLGCIDNKMWWKRISDLINE